MNTFDLGTVEGPEGPYNVKAIEEGPRNFRVVVTRISTGKVIINCPGFDSPEFCKEVAEEEIPFVVGLPPVLDIIEADPGRFPLA